MKTLYHVIALVCILHILAAAGFVGWLATSGRLNRERLNAVKDVFVQTITDEKQDVQKAKLVASQAADQAARVEAMMSGSTVQRLDTESQRHELALRQLEMTRRQIESLRANLELSRQMMEKEKKEMKAEADKVEARLAAIEKQLDDEGFKRSVQLIEQLPPEQTKKMFVTMMNQQETEQVVAYLEAMEPRKAAAVLQEFEQSDEITRVVELMERLRTRGSDLVSQTETPG